MIDVVLPHPEWAIGLIALALLGLLAVIAIDESAR